MDKLKVLVADSNIAFRRFVSEAVERTGFGITEHIASTGAIALEWLKQCSFDVVLMDVSILKAEGLQLIEKLKEEHKDLEIVILSTSEPDNAAITLEALKLGAMDFILKPISESSQINMESVKSCLKSLFTQIQVKNYTLGANVSGRNSSGIRDSTAPVRQSAQSQCIPAVGHIWKGAELVLIASSTGGPQALEIVLENLPEDFNLPVLVVQHMPPDFTRVLAQALDKKCRLKVIEAYDGARLEKGSIAIAPGGYHMILETSGNAKRAIRLINTPFVNGVKPSADVLFQSVADSCKGTAVLAVILTGMGNDGTSGIAEMKNKCDCYCITQSEKTCVVYGMPRSVSESGLSDEAADIERIAGRIVQLTMHGG